MGILEGTATISDHYDRAVKQIKAQLEAMPDARIAANSDDELTDALIQQWELGPIEEDRERPIEGSPDREFREATNDPRFFRRTRVEQDYAVLEVPLKPKLSNNVVLQLRGQTWYVGASVPHYVTWREQDHTIVLRAPLDIVEDQLKQLRQMFVYLNNDIAAHAPEFRPRVLSYVRSRREHIEAQASRFNEKMAAMGIEIKKRPDAVEPVKVNVKREIKLLREKPEGQPQPELQPVSIKQIVALIGQTGRNFETTPSTYGVLEEEQLRDIILNTLNAVFETTAATGETFSKKGKTDIFLVVPGGAVLIGECKFWGGAKLYGETIDQLFGYVTWRHTAAVMVTFSKNKGLTAVVEEAKRATKEHASFSRDLASVAETYFTSVHKHPSDDQKTIEIHQLIFDLSL